ncbi:MAG: protein phosphatase 2C domain-containing protein [Methanotrichaceae archaeon]|nr:protein phosphatase 2C domain-containing protein [Methanotrichaceae archaeon]
MISYGVSQEIGLRPRMEDAHAIRDLTEKRFFSAEVFDGHLGTWAAQIAAEVLTPHYLSLCSRDSNKSEAFCRPNAELLRQAYLWTDSFIDSQCPLCGTAAATLYLQGDQLIAANVGDVAIVIGTIEGVKILTVEHKPHIAEERTRIEAAGGNVQFLDIPRVQGELAMSRALGDNHLKPFVIPEPRIVEGILGSENDFAILACDGIWNVLYPEEAIAFARSSENPLRAANLICRAALERWSTDNITVIVLDIRSYAQTLDNKLFEISRIWDKGNVIFDKSNLL